MWHLYAEKNLVGWRQWKAVLQQKAMLFSAEEWYNPNIHLEKEVKHCFIFKLQYPSFFLFFFSIFIWQKLLLTTVWPIHSDTQLLGRQSHTLPPCSEQPAPHSAFQTGPPAQGPPPLPPHTHLCQPASHTINREAPGTDGCFRHLSERSGSGQRNRITK